MSNEIKDFKDLPMPAKVVPAKEAIHIYQPRPKETVVNSELIKWKPIDIVAARVVSKAPWYCLPPEQKEKTMSKGLQAERPGSPGRLKTVTRMNDNGVRETLISASSVDAAVAAEAIHDAPRDVDAAEELVERAKEATDTLRILTTNLGPGWDEFEDVMKKGIAHARQTRIGMEIETRQLMASLREVRQFFLDEQHDKEIRRLREFVDLCHQLKELKDSGFLDSVADTILRLS
jgi:hypothetical protein